MRHGLGKAIEYKSAPQPRVRYCPDNTCDQFRGREGSASSVQDFALVYLWYVSDYVALGEWRKRETPRQVLSVVEKNADGCRSEGPRIKCALLNLARTGAIRVSFIRYDEGGVAEVPVSLLKTLAYLDDFK